MSKGVYGHKLQISLSIICLIINSLVGVAASLFLRNLIDDYISPLLLSSSPDYSNLLFAITRISIMFLIGIIASFTSSILMNNMAQSILKKIREEMFEHMQKLPIKYFDEHTHGEIMSYYTNDIDEATSSIDTRTEKIVQDGMDKLMKDRTVFVIAHRLSTIQNAKAIMVLEEGRIIERGTHKDLLEQKGRYYELYTGKFELE